LSFRPTSQHVERLFMRADLSSDAEGVNRDNVPGTARGPRRLRNRRERLEGPPTGENRADSKRGGADGADEITSVQAAITVSHSDPQLGLHRLGQNTVPAFPVRTPDERVGFRRITGAQVNRVPFELLPGPVGHIA
jgi:hypothetical protein